MLGSFMEDIGITVEQFEAACKLSARDLAGLPAYFHRRLFEQIWAANDYEMFTKMMTHKNVELQLQVGKGITNVLMRPSPSFAAISYQRLIGGSS